MSEMQNKLYDTANEMPLIDIRDGMFSREDSFGGYDVRSVHEFLTRINKLVASDKNAVALELMDDYMDNIITVKDGGAYKNGEVCGFMDNIRYGLKASLGRKDAILSPIEESASELIGINSRFMPNTAENRQRAENEYAEMFSNLQHLDDYLEKVCDIFTSWHGYTGAYNYSSKLENKLDLDGRAYLMHDDTLMGTGKNGFAITDDGVFWIEIFERDVNHLSFDDLAREKVQYVSGGLKIHGKKVPFPCRSDDMHSLARLFNNIGERVKFLEENNRY